MTSLPDTNLDPLLKVMHSFLQHFIRHSFIFLTNGILQVIDCSRFVRVLLILKIPTKRSRILINLGERGGQWTSPYLEITCPGNICRTTSMDALVVWAVASSCWNHISLMFTCRLSSSGWRKLFQHFNVARWCHSNRSSSLFKKIGSNNLWNTAPHCYL